MKYFYLKKCFPFFFESAIHTERRSGKNGASLFWSEIIPRFGFEESPSFSPRFSSFLYRASANDCICPITGGGDGGLTRTRYFGGRQRTGLTPFFVPVLARLFFVSVSPPSLPPSPSLSLSFSPFKVLVDWETTLKSHVLSIKVCFVYLRIVGRVNAQLKEFLVSATGRRIGNDDDDDDGSSLLPRRPLTSVDTRAIRICCCCCCCCW